MGNNAVVSALVLLLALASGNACAQDKQDRQIADVIARIDNLRQEDYQLLSELGDAAFNKIYPLVNESIENYNPREESPVSRRRFYLVRALTSCAKADKTEEMTGLFYKLNSFPKGTVLDWLATEGEAAQNRDLFISVIKEENDDYGFSEYQTSAVDGLVRVADVVSIQTLIDTLQDESADEEVRSHILRVVAKTRDPAALSAVRKITQRGLAAPPVPSTVVLQESFSSFDNKFPLKHTDADGAEWGLIEWDGLGGPEDLWLVRWSGDGWVDPVFTGVNAHVQRSIPAGFLTEQGKRHLDELNELLKDDAWVERFVGNAALLVDTDGDGYTDVVERWIGLSPTDSDTDGDGLNDAQDKNPLVPARPLTEVDLALSMAFATVVGVRDAPRHTFVAFGPGIEPFELQGATGVVLPSRLSLEQATKVGAMYGFTVTLGTSFRNKTAVEFGDDGLTATVAVREDGGWYMYDGFVKLIKIDGQWYPTALVWTDIGVA